MLAGKKLWTSVTWALADLSSLLAPVVISLTINSLTASLA